MVRKTVSLKRDNFIDIKTVICSEPRIDLIRRQLESILSIAELECEGKPVRVEGFRLRNLNNWKVPLIDDPEELLRYLARMRPCPSRCEFCYIRGNPPEVIYSSSFRTSMEELRTRMKYYFSPDPYMLYNASFDREEFLSAPHCLEFMKELREKSTGRFVICTGGRYLTADCIEKLRKLQPLSLSISLNHADGEKRKKLMGDPLANIAIKALPLLKCAGISFSASIVAWSELETADIEETISYAAAYDALFIYVFLGGYTAFNKPGKERDTWEWWSEVVRSIEKMRREIECPIVTVPALFEENLNGTPWRQAKVKGVIKNSPAYFAGLRAGDIIESVGGCTFLSRPHLMKILETAEKMGILIELNISGPEGRKTILIDPSKGQYPWERETEPMGIVLPIGLAHGDIENIINAMKVNGANNALILTSVLARSSLKEALDELDAERRAQCHLSLCTVESKFFGGNIMVAELMTVSDFLQSVKGWIKESGTRPDLIVLPGSGLGTWKRDLTGRTCLEIERELDIPVTVIENVMF